MTAILPQGLINATATVEQEDALNDLELNLTNSEVLRKFWKGLCLRSPVILAIADETLKFMRSKAS